MLLSNVILGYNGNTSTFLYNCFLDQKRKRKLLFFRFSTIHSNIEKPVTKFRFLVSFIEKMDHCF